MIAAYRIGVSIALTNGMSQVLGLIQRDVLKLGHTVDLTTGKVSRMKVAVAGLASVTVGVGILMGLNSISKAADKVQDQLSSMRFNDNMTPAQVGAYLSAAQKTSGTVMTTDILANLKAAMDLRSAFGGSTGQQNAEVLRYLPRFQQAQAIVGSVPGMHGKAEGQTYALANAAELYGFAKDPQQFDRFIDGATRTMQAFNGRFTGIDFQAIAKFSKGAASGLSVDYLTQVIPTFGVDFKSRGGQSTIGRAISDMSREIVGGHATTKAARELMQFGLLDPREVIYAKNGSVKGFNPGAVRGTDLFASNPYQWVQQYLLPSLKAKGVTSPEGIKEAIDGLFSNANAGQLATLYATQQYRVDRDQALVKQARGVGAYGDMLYNSPALAREALEGQGLRIKEDLGAAISPALAHVIADLAKGLSMFAGVIEAHPQVAKVLVTLAVGLGAFLVIAGTVAIIAAGLAALSGVALIAGAIVGGLVLLGAGIYALYNNWAAVSGWTASLVASITRLWITVSTAVEAGAATAWHAATSALGNFFTWLGQAIIHGLKAIPSLLFGSANAATTAIATPMSGTQPPPVTVHTSIHMDGQKVAAAVSTHQARAAAQPPSGSSGVDARSTPLWPGLTPAMP